MAQDVRGLDHLHHEGGLTPGQVVAGADAGEDAVDQADLGALSGHEAAGVGHEHDERRLPQIGRFAAHVGTREQDDLLLFAVQSDIVRNETRGAPHRRRRTFDHWMTPLADLDPAPGRQHARPHVVVAAGYLGQGDQAVDLRQRAGQLQEPRGLLRSLRPQPLEQLLFERELAALGAEDLLFQRLQFVGDIALGIGQRLPAHVVVGNPMLLGLPHFEVVTEDPVVADLERRDAGRLAFLSFETGDVPLAVPRQRPEPIQLRVDASGDHAALGQGSGRLREHRVQTRSEFGQRIHRGETFQELRLKPGKGPQHGRRLAQGIPQGPHLTRCDPPEHGARGQPLQIGNPLQPRPERLPLSDVREQRLHPVVAVAKRRQVAQRPAQPASQHARPRPGERQVEHLDEGPARLVLEVAEDLQVAQRRLVQDHAPIVVLDLQRGDVVDIGLGRAAGVVQDQGRRGHRGFPLHQAEPAQVLHPELPPQDALGRRRPRNLRLVDLGMRRTGTADPGRQMSVGVAPAGFEVGGAGEDFPRRQPFQILDRVPGVRPAPHEELAGREIEERARTGRPIETDSGQVVRAGLVQHFEVADRARRHDPGDLPANQTLGLGRILHLVAQRDLVAGVQQLADVGVDRVVGYAAHGRLAGRTLLTRGQGHVEHRRGGDRVLEEHLEEVAHPVQEDGVGMLRLHRQVVPEHRRHRRELPPRPPLSGGRRPRILRVFGGARSSHGRSPVY